MISLVPLTRGNETRQARSRARAHFQHRIKIDSICKEEIKKSTQNEIEMQDKCKFSHRGHELGTRIASVETAACVRLVANQHRAESSRQRATSSIPGKVIGRACQAAEQEKENRLQLCTGLAWPGLGCAAYRSCFIPSSLVRLCVVYLDEWLGSPWQINSHSAIRHKLARTVQNGVPSPEFHLIRGRVRTSRLGIRL